MEYRDYKKFDKNNFLFELEHELLKGEMYKRENDMSTSFTNVVRFILDKHAPLKTKITRGNQAPFMTKSLSKAIMTRSRLRSKYIKNCHLEKTSWHSKKPKITVITYSK